MSLITKCTKCSRIIHRINYRFCCGIDYCEDNKIKAEPKKKRKRNKTPKETRLAVLERDNHKCTKCKAGTNLEVHHIIYREKGGTHDMNNLTTLCESCHTEEHKDEPVYKLRKARKSKGADDNVSK